MSNLTQRILVALVSIPIILWCSYAGGYVFGFFIGLIQVLVLSEFYSLAEAKGSEPHKTIARIAALVITILFLHSRIESTVTSWMTSIGIASTFPSQFSLLALSLTSLLIIAILIELKRARSQETNLPFANIAATIFGIIYIGLTLGMLVGVRELFSHLPLLPYASRPEFAMLDTNDIDRLGGEFVIAIFISIWICDSAAFFIGRAFGRRKLFERVSPKKTWEGAIAGFIGTAFVFAVCSQLSFGKIFCAGDWIVLTIIVGVFGQVGDLAESLLKRDAHIKDSSGLLPGHGGALDRFDSLLFVAPLVYLYLVLVVFPYR